MTHRSGLRSYVTIAILLLNAVLGTGVVLELLGLNLPVVNAQGPILGFDCALGTTTAGSDGSGNPTVGDEVLDTQCTWSVDADVDGIPDPLVSDPAFAGFPAPGTGGGFSVEVRLTDVVAPFNGFDITFSYDTKYLDGVKIDQTGLAPWDTAFTVASTIDRAAGTVRVGQVVLGSTVSTDSTLFRVRFDVVGVSASPLTITESTITDPSQVAHTRQNASFDSTVPSGGLFTLSWSFAPNPEIPGSPLTLSAIASCPTCGPLTFSWDTDSNLGTAPVTGNPVTITAPTPSLIVHRVELTVSDGTNSAVAVRRLPLVSIVQGPSTVPVNTDQTWTGVWLGGVPTYGGNWRFCPGVGTTANAVCFRPAPTFAGSTAQTNPQLLNAPATPFGPGAYHFGGVYTNTFTVREATPTWISTTAVAVAQTFLVNVTGTPLAYTVTVAASPTNPNVGETVTFTATMNYAATYPTTAGFRSATIDVNFEFGDGATMLVSASGCATAACQATATHAYSTGGTFLVRARAAETAAAAPSKIQEVGFATVTVGAPPAFDYSLAVSPATVTLLRGTTSAASTVTATLTSGTTEPVTFSIGGLPTGVTASAFSPASCSPTCSATFTLTASSTATLGAVTVTITGSPLSKTATFQLTVVDFSLSANPTTVSGNTDVPLTSTITIAGTTGFSGTVALSDDNANCAVSPASVALPPSPQTATLSCTFPSAGNFPVIVTGTNSGQSRTVTVTFNVSPAPVFDYSLAINPTSRTVLRPGTGSVTTTTDVTLTLTSGTAEAVTLSASGLPAGVTVAFSVNPVTPTGSSTATFTISSTVAPGTYTITISGSPTGATAGDSSATFTLTVTDFALSADPDSLSGAQGAALTSTISVTGLGGFTGLVALTSSIVPATGLACTLNPSSVTLPPTPQTSTLSCTGSADGSYTVTVTGGSGGQSRTTTVSVTITTFNYSLAVSPASVTLLRGTTSSSSTVTATLTSGTTEPVTFTISGLPNGVTASAFSPVSCSPTCSAMFTLTASSTAALGTVTVTVTGSPLSKTATFQLTVVDFALAADPTSVSVAVDQQGQSTISVTALGGFSGTVALSDDNANCDVSPASVTLPPTQTATLSCTFPSTGTFPVIVTGTNNGQSRTTTVTFNVGVRPTTTTVDCVPGSVVVNTQSACTATVTDTSATPLTPTGSVSFIVSGGTGTGIPGSCTLSGTGASASCSVNYTPTAVGTGTHTITGSYGGSANHAASSGTFNLAVQAPAFDYSLALDPTSATVLRPGTGSITTTTIVTLTLTSGTGSPVTLSASGLPPGVTVVFSVNPVTPTDTSTATFTIQSTVVAGTYTISISGSPGGDTPEDSTATFTLTVTDFSLSGVTPVSGDPGVQVTSTITVTGTTGFSGTVALSNDNANCDVSPASVTLPPTQTATLSCTFPSGGSFTVTVTGTSSGESRTTDVVFSIAQPFDYSLAVSPSSVTLVRATTSAASTVTATLVSGTTQPVTFTISGLPEGVTASVFTPASCSPTCSATFTLTASSTAALGTVTVTVTASPSGATPSDESATFSLTVAEQFDYSLALDPTSGSVLRPGSTTSTVTLTLTAGTGSPVTLSSSGQPVGVTVVFGTNPVTPTSAGATSTLTFTVASTVATGTFTLTISGSPSGETPADEVASFILTVEAPALSGDFAFSPASPTVGQTVTFTATVTGGTAPYGFIWNFGDESTGTGSPVTHIYSAAGDLTVVLTITDADENTATVSHLLTVLPRPSAVFLLTFDAFDADAFENGVGELDVFINGVLVVNIPAGLNNLPGTGDYDPYDDTWVSFGPFDITLSVREGLNTLTFRNPLSSHSSQIRNVKVVQGETVLLLDLRTRNIGPDSPKTVTFSVPPLVLTSFSISSTAFVSEPVSFTATFTGGTAPFRCTFNLGDGSSRSVSTNEYTCSMTHTYWSARLGTATVRVRGVAFADDVRAMLQVRVEPQPGCAIEDDNGDDNGDDDDCLDWMRTVASGAEQTFTARLTNPASISVLIRLDFTVTRPDGSKESFVSPSFTLSSAQTLTGLSFNYAPSGGPGSYCFKATPKYGIDTNSNGVLDDAEVLGTRAKESGCFKVVGPTD